MSPVYSRFLKLPIHLNETPGIFVSVLNCFCGAVPQVVIGDGVGAHVTLQCTLGTVVQFMVKLG